MRCKRIEPLTTRYKVERDVPFCAYIKLFYHARYHKHPHFLFTIFVAKKNSLQKDTHEFQ